MEYNEKMIRKFIRLIILFQEYKRGEISKNNLHLRSFNPLIEHDLL